MTGSSRRYTRLSGLIEYGLGLYTPDPQAVGHTGEHDGYVSWAGCLPAHGAVVVVLSNSFGDNIGATAAPLVRAVVSD